MLLLLVLPAVPAAAERDGPSLTAKAVLVLDNKSGKALLARNAGEQRSIASLTKLMAALVYLDRGLKHDEGTVITRDDWKVALDGCRTRLELKWTYRNIDLLHAALMASDNRAISALGRAVGLTANGLVQAMNELARRMKLRSTQFLGPAGIEPGNVSTAWEMSRIVRQASRHRTLRTIMNKREHLVKPMRGYLKVFYRNTNPVVGEKGVTFFASKTGFNHQAGYCLATVTRLAEAGDFTIVILGSKTKASRVTDLRKILRWLRSGGRQKAVWSAPDSPPTARVDRSRTFPTSS